MKKELEAWRKFLIEQDAQQFQQDINKPKGLSIVRASQENTDNIHDKYGGYSQTSGARYATRHGAGAEIVINPLSEWTRSYGRIASDVKPLVQAALRYQQKNKGFVVATMEMPKLTVCKGADCSKESNYTVCRKPVWVGKCKQTVQISGYNYRWWRLGFARFCDDHLGTECKLPNAVIRCKKDEALQKRPDCKELDIGSKGALGYKAQTFDFTRKDGNPWGYVNPDCTPTGWLGRNQKSKPGDKTRGRECSIESDYISKIFYVALNKGGDLRVNPKAKRLWLVEVNGVPEFVDATSNSTYLTQYYDARITIPAEFNIEDFRKYVRLQVKKKLPEPKAGKAVMNIDRPPKVGP